MEISVDFNKKTEKLKPLHGICNGPLTANFSKNHIRDFYRAGVPFCRLHDSEYPKGSGLFVDIHCIFPDMDKDPENPENYHFAESDRYIQAIYDAGAKVIYRLGESIDHNPVKEFVYPPKNNEKWANVCEHIVAHYTEDFADGMHLDIPFWEIWNEPDNEPEIAANPMWQGTEEQFFSLYVCTANRLKKRFPHLMIGGYASCGFYAITGTDASAAAKSSPRLEYFVDFANRFLRYIIDPAHRAPLDFFSWHSYAGKPEDNVKFATYARNLLDHYGFFDTLSVLDEWNPRPARVENCPEEAAAILAHLCALQKAPLDIATYYDGRPGSVYCGLFGNDDALLSGYDAILYYGIMYRSDCAVETDDVPPVYSLAVRDGDYRKLLLVNLSGHEQNVSLKFFGAGKLLSRITRKDTELAMTSDNEVTLLPWQFAVITYDRKDS